MENLPDILTVLREERTQEEHEEASNALNELLSDESNFPYFFQFAIEFPDKALGILAISCVTKRIQQIIDDGNQISQETVQAITIYFTALSEDRNTTFEDFYRIEPILHLKQHQNNSIFNVVISNCVLLKKYKIFKLRLLQSKPLVIKNTIILVGLFFGIFKTTISVPVFDDPNMKYYFASLCFELINELLPNENEELDLSVEAAYIKPIQYIFKSSLDDLGKGILNERLFVRLWKSAKLLHLLNNDPGTLDSILSEEFVSNSESLILQAVLDGFTALPYYEQTEYHDINFALRICAYSAVLTANDFQREQNISCIFNYEESIEPLFDIFPDDCFEAFMSLFEEDIYDLSLISYFVIISYKYPHIIKENIEVIVEKIASILGDTSRETYEVTACINITTSLESNLYDVLKKIYPLTFTLIQQIPEREDGDFLVETCNLFQKTASLVPQIIDISQVVPLLQQLCSDPNLAAFYSNFVDVIGSFVYIFKESDIECIKELFTWAISQELEDKKMQFQIINIFNLISPEESESTFNEFLSYFIELINTTNYEETASCVTACFIIIKTRVEALKSNTNPNILELYEASLAFVDRNLESYIYQNNYLCLQDTLKEIMNATNAIREFLHQEYSELLKSILVKNNSDLALEMCSLYRDDEIIGQRMGEALESELETIQSGEDYDSEDAIYNNLSNLLALVNEDTAPSFEPVFEHYEKMQDEDIMDEYLKLLDSIIINGHKPECIDTIVDFIIDQMESYATDDNMFINFIITCIKYGCISDEEIQKIVSLFSFDPSSPDIEKAMQLLITLITIVDTREDLRESFIQTTNEVLVLLSQIEDKSEELEQIVMESVLVLHYLDPELIDQENFIAALSRVNEQRSFVFLDTLTCNVFPQILTLDIGDEYKLGVINLYALQCNLYEKEMPESINCFTKERFDFCFQFLMQYKSDENVMALVRSNYPILSLSINNTDAE